MANLTGKTISELPSASSMGDNDLFAVSQGGASKKVSKSTMLGPYVLKAGDTLSGSLTTANTSPGSVLKSTNKTDGTAPDSNTNSLGFRLRDQSDNNIALFTDRWLTNGQQGAWMAGFRNGVGNSLFLLVNASGNPVVSVSDSAAWRSGLGLCYAVNDTLVISSSAVLCGMLNSAMTTAYLDFAVDKSLENISTITVTSMSGSINGVQGVLGGSSVSVDYTGSGYTIAVAKQSNTHIRIGITKSAAWTNATGNTPVTYFGTISLKFT